MIIGSALVGIVALVTVLLVSERQLIMDERLSGVRQAVEAAHGVVAHFHRQATDGRLSDADARQAAMRALKALRYSGSEYFWINDMQPRMVMHPIKPDLDGQDLSGMADPQGNHLFVRFVETVRQSRAGAVRYLWPKPGSEQPVEKVSYVAGFEPWGWVIGSGVYTDTVNETMWRRSRAFVIGALVVIAGLLALGLRIARGMLRQLGGEPHEAAQIAQRIAAGELDVPIRVRPGDQGSLLLALQTMRDALSRIVDNVHQGSASVALASREIAQGNLDLSHRTEQQAATLQQTAAAMKQMGGTVRRNASGAQQADQLARQASSVASEGGAIVTHMVQTMKGISDSSSRISDIIGLIDSIAFQTNILALNAAVEAARAGEQGRGFAVVAAEVRTLAQRSAESARQIKSLITESVDQVGRGNQLVDQAGQAMAQIVDAIQRVTGVMSSITAAGDEQSREMAQIDTSVQQMDEATQRNAALVEQSAAAAASLQDQAQRLLTAVSAFQTQGVRA